MFLFIMAMLMQQIKQWKVTYGKASLAVKNGKVYLYGDNYHDEFVMEDPFSLELQLDTIVNLLLDTTK